jgi:hypothetical protein
VFTGNLSPLLLVELELTQPEYEEHPVPDSIKEKVAALDKEKDNMKYRGHRPYLR